MQRKRWRRCKNTSKELNQLNVSAKISADLGDENLTSNVNFRSMEVEDDNHMPNLDKQPISRSQLHPLMRVMYSPESDGPRYLGVGPSNFEHQY